MIADGPLGLLGKQDGGSTHSLSCEFIKSIEIYSEGLEVVRFKVLLIDNVNVISLDRPGTEGNRERFVEILERFF